MILSTTLPFEEASLTALLNREVWASGMSLFVDLHISNRSRRTVKRVNILLERTIMLFYHAPTEMIKGVRRHSRLPDRVLKKIVTANAVEKSKDGWHGIGPHSQDQKLWLLDIPPNLATIPTGEFYYYIQLDALTVSIFNGGIGKLKLKAQYHQVSQGLGRLLFLYVHAIYEEYE